MANNFCDSCGNSYIGPGESILVSYVASAVALLVPFINSAGSNVTATLSLKGLEMSMFSLIIIGVWLLSGYVNGREKHSSYALCAINSLGLPGLLMTIMAVSGK